MNSRVILITTALLLASGIFVLGQHNRWWNRTGATSPKELDAHQEWERLCARFYQEDSSFYVLGTIRLYDEELNHQLKEHTSFTSYRAGDYSYFQLASQQTFTNANWVVHLDTLHQYLHVAKRDQMGEEQELSAFPSAALLKDTTLSQLQLRVTEQNGTRTLLLHSDLHPEIRSCSLTYEPGTYTIRRTDVEWWKEALVRTEPQKEKIWKAEVEYHYQTGKSFPVEDRINQILEFGADSVKVLPRFSHYRFTDDSQ